ncbi:MAG: VOC family protein [Alphaproteobacteria bacterium]|nr:VOC family protein [Alphaproteobacteria bacterium]
MNDASALSAVRRATIFVPNLQRALTFYARAFGFREWYRNDIDLGKLTDFPVGDPGRKGKALFVIMRGWDPQIGMLGLIEIQDPPLPIHKDRRLRAGQAALVIETSDIARCEQQIRELGGEIIRAPMDGRNIGSISGTPFPATVLFAWDPDGQFLEVFQRKG